MNQAWEAGKRGDYAAQEKFLKKELALDFDEMAAGDLLRLQEKRGEYADALVTMREIMNPVDPNNNPGNAEVLGRYSAGPPNSARYRLATDEMKQLLHYAKLCDKVGAKEEGAIVWGRVMDSANKSGVLGKNLPLMAGHKLTQSQLRVVEEAAVVLTDVNTRYLKRIAAAQAVLAAVPQCEPARLIVANYLYAKRDAKGQVVHDYNAAAGHYRVLARSSDAATRKEAKARLQDIADAYAEEALEKRVEPLIKEEERKWAAMLGPAYAKLPFSFTQHLRLTRKNGKVVAAHYMEKGYDSPFLARVSTEALERADPSRPPVVRLINPNYFPLTQ